MRGIISSFLSLVLMLLLVQAGSAQNVTIDLTPITYPIVLPDSGGSFDYLLTVTNQGSAITATVWCMATLPNGSSWGPVVGPAMRTLGAGQTQSYYRTQVIPPRAPFGYYIFHAYVGIYPDTAWAEDEFEFQHQAVSGTEQEWVLRYNGTGNSYGYDKANAVALDEDGNIYVTGYSDGQAGSGSNYDYVTIKYNPQGLEQWVARYNGSGNGSDWAKSIIVDGGGYVYVTGWSSGSQTSSDYATIKYNSAGLEQWVAGYARNGLDEATSLAVDGDGSVYVTGWSDGSETDRDYATIKYNSSGAEQWVVRYNGVGNHDDLANAIAVDGGGNIYVTGSSMGSGTGYDYVTIKYNSAGMEQWLALYNGPANSTDKATSLAVDGSGNIYVTGYSHGSETDYDYVTIKYDSAGAEQWAARYNGPGYAEDEATAMSLDANENVYVTGCSIERGINYDYATIKYSSAGVEQWVARYNGPGNYLDWSNSIALDESGNVYVTGYSDGLPGSGTNYDYSTIKYDSAGTEQWVARYDGPGNGGDNAYSIAVNGAGIVYVTGGSGGSGTGYDYATLKYSSGNIANWLPVEATVLGQPLPQECRLEENFPNPFNATTALSYKLQAPSHISLRVYDMAGRLVATLVDGWRAAGEHELTWDASDLPSGMYFARLEAGDYMGVQKLILLK